LATESHDHPGQAAPADGDRCLLGLDDVEHVLVGHRLEVEPGGGVVVRRDRLGVAVDHHRLEAGLAQGKAGMHAAVVELDPLADPVGSRTEDDHRRPGDRPDLGRVLVSRVVVRSARGEFGRARVDGLEHGRHPGGKARSADCRGGYVPKKTELGIGEAEPLHPAPGSSIEAVRPASWAKVKRSSVIWASWSKNHGSTRVISANRSTVIPRRSAASN